MVNIEINEEIIELSADATIDISFKSPLGSVSAMRTVSLPFRFPTTPKTLSTLKNIQRFDTIIDVQSVPTRLFLLEQLIEKGFFNIEKITAQSIDGHFQNDIREYEKELEAKKIHEFLNTIDIPQPQTGRWEFEIDAPFAGRPYFFSINGFGINYTATASDTKLNVSGYVASQITALSGVPASSQYFSPYRLIVSSTGQSVSFGTHEAIHLQSGFQTYGQARQKNFNNFIQGTLTTPREDFTWGFMSNLGLYDKDNVFTGEINRMIKNLGSNVWTLSDNEFYAENGSWQYTYVPFLRLSFILKKITDFMGLPSYEGNFDEWTEIIEGTIIYNAYPLDDEIKEFHFDALSYLNIEKYGNVFVKTIDLKNHVPDMTALDFLQQFCETLNLYWHIKEGKLFFSKKDDLLRGQPKQLPTARFVPDSDERGFKKREGFVLKYKKDDKNTAYAVPDYKEGAGKTDIELPTTVLNEGDYVGRLACVAKHKAEKPSNLSFMLHRGERLRSDGAFYYFQTATGNKDAQGIVIGNVSFFPIDLIRWAWRETARIRAYGFPLSFRMNIQLQDLIVLKKFETAIYRVDTPKGAVVVAVDEIGVTADINGMKEVKITGIGRY